MMERLGEGPISGQQKQIDNLIAGMTDESDEILAKHETHGSRSNSHDRNSRSRTEVRMRTQRRWMRLEECLDDSEDPAEALRVFERMQ